MTVDDIAQCASITPGTAIAYISYLRRQYGYTSIDGTPAKGYRLGEWPGREVPGRKGRPRGVVEQRHRVARHYRFDSGDGVVVTAAGKALGL